MKGTIKILDRTGHTLTPYDTDLGKSLVSDEEIEAGINTILSEADARALVEREISYGKRLFALDEEHKGEMVTEFNPAEHPNVLLVPAIQGG